MVNFATVTHSPVNVTLMVWCVVVRKEVYVVVNASAILGGLDQLVSVDLQMTLALHQLIKRMEDIAVAEDIVSVENASAIAMMNMAILVVHSVKIVV